MRRSPVLGLAAAVLALAGAAGAKGPLPVRICGASGCVPLFESAQSALLDGLGAPFTQLDSPPPSPFYVIRLRRFDRRDPAPRPWLLAGRAIRIAETGMRPYWRSLSARATTALRQAAARVKPYPASPTWSTGPAAGRALAGSPTPESMLGISFRNVGGTLAWFDPLTLTALTGRKAPLAKRGGGGWAFSADRSIVALGSWETAELRFVNARTMRVLGDLRLARGATGGSTLAWVRPDRILAIVYDQPSPLLVVVDPQRRRVIRRVVLPGGVFDTARIPGGLALLIGSYEEYAPATVVVADADGNVRQTVVSRVRVGTVVDQDSGDYRARTMSPGFAVDPDGRRAFLVAADSTVAEVDLERLDVAYHQLDRPSFLGRLARWLSPDAQAKGRTHTVDADVSDFLVAGDLVIASGGSYDLAEPEADARGVGIVAYGRDGRERWRLHPGERRWLTPAGALGYVSLDEQHMEVVDLATGVVDRRLERQGEPWPWLLADRASTP